MFVYLQLRCEYNLVMDFTWLQYWYEELLIPALILLPFAHFVLAQPSVRAHSKVGN